MGNQHQGRALFAVQVKHQLHDFFAGGEVQAAGGFVGQQYGRLHYKGTRQRHALLLATAQHLGVRIEALRQAHAGQHLGGSAAGVFAAIQFQRQHHVF